MIKEKAAIKRKKLLTTLKLRTLFTKDSISWSGGQRVLLEECWQMNLEKYKRGQLWKPLTGPPSLDLMG